jgi:hypothetical protein
LSEPDLKQEAKPGAVTDQLAQNSHLKRNYLFLRRMFVSAGEIRAKYRVEIDEIYLLFCLIFVADADALTGAEARRAGGASAHTISQMTDVPRETVRRKMQRLIVLGAVSQDSGKLYRLNHQSPLVDSILSGLTRMTDEMTRINS